MMIKNLTLWLCALLSIVACNDSLQDPILDMMHSSRNEKEITVTVQSEEKPYIEMRAAEATDPDSKIEHISIIAYDVNGKYVKHYSQDLNSGSGNCKIRMLVDKEKVRTLVAICNYPELCEKIDLSDQNTLNGNAARTLSELNKYVIKGSNETCAFSNLMIMSGNASVGPESTDIKIMVNRIAAKINFELKFEPEASGDEFTLSEVELHQIPLQSYLMYNETDRNNGLEPNPNDAVHYALNITPSDNPDDPEVPYEATDPEHKYLAKSKLKVTALEAQNYEVEGKVIKTVPYISTFYLFENRRGTKDISYYDKKFPNLPQYYQTLKAKVGRMEYPYATFIRVKGFYKRDTGSIQTTIDVSYDIYLGENAINDFNIKRNCEYKIRTVIRSIDDLDTRVNAVILNSSKITPFFDNPFDAHYGVGQCYAHSQNCDWELYVEDADKHPWLEISFSRDYKPRLMGQNVAPGQKKFYANTHFEGDSALSEFFYIHVDEFLPENEYYANEKLNIGQNGISIALDSTYWREGNIVLRDKKNGTVSRIKVKQRPAQIIRMEYAKGKFNEYFVEYALEQKNLCWGFLQYPANPVMTSMINDRWDGLANTRRLYQEAIRKNGAYNSKKWPPNQDFENSEIAAANLPVKDMIGYVMTKNRDRNGNGFIDYDEIEWYVPAAYELLELWRVIDEKHLEIECQEERFFSSTPYLSGYTVEIPGRCFYVKSKYSKREKRMKKYSAFTMRDRKYNVICCRRKNAWIGKPEGHTDGDLIVDPDWNEDDNEIILPKTPSSHHSTLKH